MGDGTRTRAWRAARGCAGAAVEGTAAMPHPSLAPSWLAVSGPCARMDASWILERMHAATSIVAFSSPCMRSASTNILSVRVRACVRRLLSRQDGRGSPGLRAQGNASCQDPPPLVVIRCRVGCASLFAGPRAVSSPPLCSLSVVCAGLLRSSPSLSVFSLSLAVSSLLRLSALFRPLSALSLSLRYPACRVLRHPLTRLRLLLA